VHRSGALPVEHLEQRQRFATEVALRHEIIVGARRLLRPRHGETRMKRSYVRM
jgi:hypothetical protein